MISLASLIQAVTQTQIYERALAFATKIDLPVTSWQEGDPTRSLYHVLSESLAVLEQVAARYVASGFLDLAAALPDPKWLKMLAVQQYGYTAREASYATATVRLTNTGGGLWLIAPGDLTFRATATGKTYRNTTGGTLDVGPGTILELEVEAEEPGSESSAAVGDINALVTVLIAVAVSNTTPAIGIDAESNQSIVAGCRAKLMSLSPMGPAQAYQYVALNSELTGTTNVTRVRVNAISTDGTVQVIIAGAAATTEDDRLAVEQAILRWATPLCITPIITAATPVMVDVDATVYVYDTVNATDTEIQSGVSNAVTAAIANLPIGGNGEPGMLHQALLIATIQSAFADSIFNVQLHIPAADSPVGPAEVPVLGTCTIAVVRQVYP